MKTTTVETFPKLPFFWRKTENSEEIATILKSKMKYDSYTKIFEFILIELFLGEREVWS